jgi:acetyltransferase-like isoleucine patch superfamily enzyme
MGQLKGLVIETGLRVLDRLPAKGRRWKALHRRLTLGKLYRQDMALWRVEKARDLGVKVGTGCRFFSLEFQSEPYLIEIGNDVILSGQVILVTHDGAVSILRGEVRGINGHYGRIKIGNNCFIGMGAIIMPGVELGDNCIVSAGSVVYDSFPPNSVILGNPAKYAFSVELYKKMKLSSPYTIVDERYPFPAEYPPSDLIARMARLPLKKPRRSGTS